jgi:lipopolysaccharide biosynthesis glycosyltransferase
MPIIKERYCLATVTSRDFIPGTLVMIHSFLEHNRWFDGDITIIHDSLPQQYLTLLSRFKNMTFLQVGEEIKDKLRVLGQAVPALHLETKIDHFYSLEVFRLSGYRQVFFCDSDILLLGDIGHLFNQPDGGEEDRLLCCGDCCVYQEMPRDAETFLPIPTTQEMTSPQETLTRTFNSGFMIIAGAYLTHHHYRDLLDLLEPEIWQKVKAPQTDQVVFNLYFRDQCRLLSGRYNFLVPYGNMIRKKENLLREDIKTLHFIGRIKPWNCFNVIEAVVSDPSVIEFIRLWHHRYLEFLPQFHLRYHFANK